MTILIKGCVFGRTIGRRIETMHDVDENIEDADHQ